MTFNDSRYEHALRLAAVIAFLLYLVLLLSAIARGTTGANAATYTRFVREQKWNEIVAVASNLQMLNEDSSTAIFYAAFAAEQLNRDDLVRRFVEAYLQQKVLHLNMELTISRLMEPSSTRQRLQMYRTRISYAIISVLLIVTMIRRYRRISVIWSAALSLTGITVLLL